MTKNEAWQRFECWKSPGVERDRACFDAGWDARNAEVKALKLELRETEKALMDSYEND